jgi:hypothetical protein
MPRFEKSGDKPNVPIGYYNTSIVDFLDISDKLKQWGDWSFEAHCKAESVPFELKITYIIKFDRTSSGELDPDLNSWASQFNNLLDTIEYYGGFDRYGVFRDAAGEEIALENILETLLLHIQSKFPTGHPFLIYIEKDPKGYMRPMKRIYQHKDKAELESFVEYRQNKGKKTTPAPPRKL